MLTYITNQSIIEVSGEGNGRISIFGKHLFINGSSIKAKTLADKNNAAIDIQIENLSVYGSKIDARTKGKGTNILVNIQANDSASFYNKSSINMNTYSKNDDAGNAGMIIIEAQNISFINGSGISNSTVGKGNAGKVVIRASELFNIKNNSSIYISPFSSSTGGNGGELLVEAKNVLVAEGSYLSGTTFGPGKGGQITILANGKVTLSEANENGLASGIFSNSNPSKATANDAGNIIIKAKELTIEKGAMISSSTISKPGKTSSKGGDITLQVDETITLQGVNLYGENTEGFGSGVYVRPKGNDTGIAGNINIKTKFLSVTDGAVIASTTDSDVPGGHINIQIKDNIYISGNSKHLLLREPKTSQISFRKNFPESQYNLSISGIYGNSDSLDNNAGMAGDIILNTNSINILNGGLINTSTQNSGGGNISINTSNIIYLQNGEITTSVKSGKNDGGNITIKEPTFVVLNQGKIKSQADAGNGGNIYIKANHFITSTNSLISASSRLGLDGIVNIDSPNMDIDGFLIALPDEVTDASDLIKTPCNQRLGKSLGSFLVNPSEGSRSSPDDLLSSGLLLSDNLPIKSTAFSRNSENKLAFSTCKKF